METVGGPNNRPTDKQTDGKAICPLFFKRGLKYLKVLMAYMYL